MNNCKKPNKVLGFLDQGLKSLLLKSGKCKTKTKRTKDKRLEEIYRKIEGMLRDPDIRAEIGSMGKDITTAEGLVDDVDFRIILEKKKP